MSKIRVCVLGLGRHGRACFLATQWLSQSGQLVGVEIEYSLCSSNAEIRAGNWRGFPGSNLGITLPDEVDLKKVRVFEKPEEVEADLVWICAPTSEHRRLAEYFLRKNISVLLEKPIALNADESQAILDCARESEARLMLAHELVYFPDFKVLHGDLLHNNDPLRVLRLVRQISQGDETVGVDKIARFGGPVIDLHIHDNHLLLLALGMPISLRSVGYGDKSAGYYESGVTYYKYLNGLTVVSEWGAVAEPNFLFRHGFQVLRASGRQSNYQLNVVRVGEKVINFALPPMTEYGIGTKGDRPVCCNLVVPSDELDIPNNLGPLVGELKEAIGTVVSGTGRQWFSAGQGWKPSSPLCPLAAHQALRLCLLERESWLRGEEIVVE